MPKILIVDDEWLTRLEIEKMLTDLSYDVAGQAETGAEAVALARELSPDLILMDVKMPGEMNGIDAAREIKKELKIPIVFISGYGDPEYIEAAKEVAPFGYVMKPFDEREVHAFVEIALSRRKLELELEESHERLEQTNLDLQKEITTRNNTEMALRESEEKYRSLFEQSKDALVITTSHGKVIDANSASMELLGYTKKEILELDFQKLYVDPDDGYRLLKEMKEKGSVKNFEAKVRGKDHVEMDCILDLVCRRGNDGKILQYQGLIRDISEAKRAQEALKASQERLSQIISFLPDATFVIDLEGKVIAWNRAIEAMTGVKAEEILGKGDYEYAIPFYGERRPILIDLACKPNKEIEEKYQYVKKEGESLVSEAYDPINNPGGFQWNKASLLYDHNGEVIGAIESIRDITDIKATEEALRESEIKLSTLLNATTEVAALAETDGTFVACNDALAKSLGKKKEEIIGKPMMEIFSTEAAERRKTLLQGIVASKKPLQWEDEHAGRYFDNSVYPILDGNGNVKQLALFARNITDQKKAEELLKEKQQMNDLLLNSMPYPIMLINKARVIMAANKIALDTGVKIGDYCWKSFGKCEYLSDKDQICAGENPDAPEIQCTFCRADEMFKTNGPANDPEVSAFGRLWDAYWIPLNDNQYLHYNIDVTDQKQTEAESVLRESEKKYRTLVESNPFGFQDIDSTGIITYTNATYQQMTGYTQEELSGKSILDLIEPASKRDELSEYLSMLAKEQPEPTTYSQQYQTKDGRVIDIEVSWRYNRDNKGGVVGFSSIITDVTDRKQAEVMVRESEEKHRALIENLSDLVLVLDEDGINVWNSPAVRQYGIEPEDAVGRSCFEYVHPDDLEKAREVWGKTIANPGKKFIYEIRATGTPENPETWIYQHNTAVYLPEVPGINGVVAVCRNVTEQKLAENALLELNEQLFERTTELELNTLSLERQRELVGKKNIDLEETGKALRESEVQYRTLLNNLPVGVYRNTPGPEGRFLMANPAFCKIFAYENEEEVKKIAVADLYPNREERKQYSDALIKEGVLKDLKRTLLKKDGTPFHASITSSAGYGKDGEISHFDSIVVDITNQEALEDRLQQAQKMESIGALAGGVAHDFNNVLYAMIGFTELALEDTPEGSLIRKNLNQVLQGAMRAKDMVKQILTFSRQSGAKKKPIKIQRVVKETLKLLRASIPSTIEIRQDIDPACDPVLADQTQIHQVVMNLAINAYHAMREEGGALELRLTQEKIGPDDSDADLSPGAYLKLTVKDTGHGMDSALMKRVFDPYFTTKGVGEGTGMGLAVVHGIAKDHGGDIRVNSRMGEGTSFHFYLPVIETTAVEAKNLASGPARRGNERILFVDDEEMIVSLAQQTLVQLGYHVTSLTSSMAALEAFKAKPDNYDLVITDMAMPKMTGAQLTAELQEIRPDIPVILCTGFSETIDEGNIEIMGISAYIEKPILRNKMAEAIRRVFDEMKEE